MERLTDERRHADAAAAQLADLLRTYRTGSQAPVLTPAGRKQLLLRGVLTGRRSPGAHRALLLRPAVALSVLLLAGATLAATAGHDFLARGLRRLAGSAAERTPVSEARGTREAASPPPAPPEVEAPPAIVAEPSPSPTEAKVALPAAAPARGHVPRAIEHARVAKGEDPSKVVAAICALRSEHDPVHARALLSAYLQQYPNGALSEEALALSIEAATALHDASAATFAARYLRAYPRGRFRRTAEQALRSP